MQKGPVILKLATALLYAGPLVAGLGGSGWAMAPAFVLVFLLWQVLQRPRDWHRTPLKWRTAPRLTRATFRIALLAGLVVLLFGLGRGIGGVLGHLPAMPSAAPLLASLMAVPLARLAGMGQRAPGD